MPQSLYEFVLRLYTLDDRVWAGITRKLIAASNVLDASRSVKIRSGIVAYTVGDSSLVSFVGRIFVKGLPLTYFWRKLPPIKLYDHDGIIPTNLQIVIYKSFNEYLYLQVSSKTTYCGILIWEIHLWS